MALSFKNTKGKAQSNKVESYEYKDGENTVRLVGGVLPRYIYWLKGTNNKDIPVECLAFSREKEKFDNVEKDHVNEYFPDFLVVIWLVLEFSIFWSFKYHWYVLFS